MFMSRSFVLKAPRPLSDFSLDSEAAGERAEDDTFAFKQHVPMADRAEDDREQPSNLSISTSTVPSTIPPFRVRPLSLGSSSNEGSQDDTFQFLPQRALVGSVDFPSLGPRSGSLDDSFAQFEPPSFSSSADGSFYTVPTLVAPLVPRCELPSVSPLQLVKRKATSNAEEPSPRKARIVCSSSLEAKTSIGLRTRESLEDSCLVGSGEDASFSLRGALLPFLANDFSSFLQILDHFSDNFWLNILYRHLRGFSSVKR